MKICRFIVAFLFSASFHLYALAVFAEESGKQYHFDLPAGSAVQALGQFAEQVERPFMVRFSLLKDRFTNDLVGSYGINEALMILLKNTGLEASLNERGHIEVVRIKGYINNDIVPPAIEYSVPLLEEVIVSGMRYAWYSSAALKRNATAIIDVINEHDIGQLPDGNIADTLRRLPAVQLERRNGDGTKVRVRGLDKNVTLFNGEVFLSGMEYITLGIEEQAYENSIETVPIELLRRIEVSKSQRASDIEGAVGGTIDLISRSAFDVNDYLAVTNFKIDQGRYSDKVGPELFLGIGKNWEDKFALMFTTNIGRRVMHMDVGQNYAASELDGVPLLAQIRQIEMDDETVDVLSPQATRIMDIEQQRDQLGSSLHAAWNISDNIAVEVEWFGIFSELRQRNYELYSPVADISLLPEHSYKINQNNNIAFLEKAENFDTFSPSSAVGRTVGERFDTAANNLNIKVNLIPNQHLSINNQLTIAKSRFSRDLGNADIDNILKTTELPIWVGTEELTLPAGFPIRLPSGWASESLFCTTCQDPEIFDQEIAFSINDTLFSRYKNDAFLANPNFVYNSFNRAKGSYSMQNVWSVRTDVSLAVDEENVHTVNFGGRIEARRADFERYRYLTDLSRTVGAAQPNLYDTEGNLITVSNFSPDAMPDEQNVGIALPVLYDLCGNGGIPSGKVCDITGDGQDDNQPIGPWLYELNPSIQRDLLPVKPFGFNSYLLYSQVPLFPVPGAVPWRKYRDSPNFFTQVNHFLPSQNYSVNPIFVNADPIKNDVETWIDSVAPNSPVQRFSLPQYSWSVEQNSKAFYLDYAYEPINLPIQWVVGVRVVRTELEVTRSIVGNVSEAYSLTPNPWHSSSLGTGWVNQTVRSHYTHWLPAGHFVWRMTDAFKLRVAASKNIFRPNFRQLGLGDNPFYETETAFEGMSTIERDRAIFLETGNPRLAPEEVTQGDISLEYYGKDNDFLQLTLFYKKIDNFIKEHIGDSFLADESLDGGAQVPTEQERNNGSRYAKGFEVGLQKQWSDHWGATLNYAYISSQSQLQSISGRSYGILGAAPRSLNFSVFYESSNFHMRLSYAWQDELVSPYYPQLDTVSRFVSESPNIVQVIDAHGQWDANLSYSFSERLTLNLDLINIAQRNQSSYLEYSKNTLSSSVWEPRAILGVEFQL